MKYFLPLSGSIILLIIIQGCRNETPQKNWLGSGYQVLIEEFKPDSSSAKDASAIKQCLYITEVDFGFQTSMINLLANPAKYHRKRIFMQGFLYLGVEGDQLYLTELDYKRKVRKNALWLHIENIDKRKEVLDSLNARYIMINAEFDERDTCLLNPSNGGLKKISRIYYVR